jgi:hypothetical protein
VQHPKLWQAYCLHKQEMEESLGEAGGGGDLGSSLGMSAHRHCCRLLLTCATAAPGISCKCHVPEDNTSLMTRLLSCPCHHTPTGINEKQCFHGASPPVIDLIINEGFDMRLANTYCTYGQGTYFADAASTALGYCGKPIPATAVHPAAAGGQAPYPGAIPMAGMPPPAAGGWGWQSLAVFGGAAPAAAAWAAGGGGAAAAAAAAAAAMAPAAGMGLVLGAGTAAAPAQHAGCYQMILARVLLGRQVVGAPGMRRPPPGFESVHGNGMCHVVFDNDQAYPEYVITFRP